jgi:hypothetical protein
VLQGYYGLGRHSEAVSKQDRITFEKISFFQAIISAIGALGMLKISIALFLLRLSQNKWFSRSLWALIGKSDCKAVLAHMMSACLTVRNRLCRHLFRVSLSLVSWRRSTDFNSGAWLTFFLRCRPMAAFWNPGLSGTCYSTELFKSVAMANTGE